MAANDIVSEFTKICKELMRSVREAQAGTSAYEVEACVFDRILKIGALAMEAFFESQAPHYHRPTTKDADGRLLRYRDERSGLFYSIFGAIQFRRSYYCGDGHGAFALDAALNLAPKGQSDFVRKMVEELSINMSYEDATAFVARYFPVATSTRAVQAAILTDSQDAEAFYDQAPAPAPCEEATILVVEADNKGVPMVKSAVADADAATPTPGKIKGERKRDGKTKESTVVSVSTHVPFLRTPEQVRDSLFRDLTSKDKVYSDAREKPAFKRTWATMGGKRKGLAQADVWVRQVLRPTILHRITLVDGGEALQRRVDEQFPDFVRVLDLIHAIQYLWKAADAQFGKGNKKGWQWVYAAVLRMLQGEIYEIVLELDGWLLEIGDRDHVKSEPIGRSANYFEKNMEAMKYDEYLKKGWPIATGIIEGACRHVVKDRCERSGMRWTEQGVEAFLHLRCIHQNADWDAYHAFRMKQRQERIYGIKSQDNNTLLETDIRRFTTKTNYEMAI